MEPKFYILVDGERQDVTPEPQELKDALNSIKWGAKNGIVSLKTPIRTTTTYWEV
jgi:hypothetical protein